jgi:aromatic ring-cleaving dioxygenase
VLCYPRGFESPGKVDKAVASTDVDDIEVSNTPESILLGAMSDDGTEDHKDGTPPSRSRIWLGRKLQKIATMQRHYQE